MASGSHGSPSSLTGNIKLWDVRAPGRAVWELKERIDCFSDVAVSGSLSGIFKVGINSSEVWFIDLRNLKMSSGRGGNRNNNGAWEAEAFVQVAYVIASYAEAVSVLLGKCKYNEVLWRSNM